MQRFPYGRTLLLGFGFFGISIIWPLFNNFVPLFLAEMGLGATLIGFIMTWDNYINMFVQPVVGEKSDETRTRIGRRKPWLLVGMPVAALFFVTVPMMGSAVGIMFAILFTNLGMAIFRSPTVALLGDLYPPAQRSLANGLINLMGGLGAVVAFVGGGWLYGFGRITPFLFGSLVMVATVLLVVLLIREPEQPEAGEEEPQGEGFVANVRQVLASADRSGLYILLAILCWFMGFNAMETWLSSLGRFALGIEPGRMSLITSGFALLFVIFAVPSGLIGTRYGRKPTIMVGIVGMSTLFIFGWFVRSEAALIGLLVLAGISWALINVNSLPMVYDVGGPLRIGAFTGLYYFATNIAAVIGPQTVGILIDATAEMAAGSGANYRVMFLFSALFMCAAGLLMSRVKEAQPGIS